MMKPRERGYYWIILRPDHSPDGLKITYEWEVAFYESEGENEGWYSIWDGGHWLDEQVMQINEIKIVPPSLKEIHNG